MKRSFVLSALATAVLLAPAVGVAHPVRHAHVAAVQPASSPYQHRSSYGGPDPYGVYIGGQKIGRDPDPNVRQQLVYDWIYEHSW